MASKFAQGKFALKNPEKYMGNRTPTYRSSWEWAVMQMFDNNQAIEKWGSEVIKVPYRDPLTGKHTIYVPDFFVKTCRSLGSQTCQSIIIRKSWS